MIILELIRDMFRRQRGQNIVERDVKAKAEIRPTLGLLLQ
jgi:hypothetical protein